MRQIYILFSANKTFSAIYAQIMTINLRTVVFFACCKRFRAWRRWRFL